MLIPGQTTQVPVLGRARISTWISFNNLHYASATMRPKNSYFSGLTGLDDITWLPTLAFTDRHEEFKWAANFLPGLSNEKKEEFLVQCIQYFHAKKIQVLVGIYADSGNLHGGRVNVDNATFLANFIRNSTSDFAGHARALVAFFDDKNLDIDGISYDLESGANGAPALTAADAPRMKEYYEAVAAELRKEERFLAYATGAAMSGSGG